MAIAAWWRSLSPESSGAQQMVVVAWWRSLSPESSGARQRRTSRLSGGRYRPNQAALGGDPFSCPRRADAACARRGSLRFVREVDPVARAIEPLESRSSSPVPSAARSRSLPLPPVGAVRSRLLSPVQAALGLSRLGGDRYRPNQAGFAAMVIARLVAIVIARSSGAWWRCVSSGGPRHRCCQLRGSLPLVRRWFAVARARAHRIAIAIARFKCGSIAVATAGRCISIAVAIARGCASP